MQRLLVTFTKGDAVKYISHLDLMRVFERAARRARLPIAYTQGFNPQMRLMFAAPLAVGATSEAELMDLLLVEERDPLTVAEALREALPAGITVRWVQQVPERRPSLQARVRWAEYLVRVHLDEGLNKDELTARAYALLSMEFIPTIIIREDKARTLDIRPLLHAVEVIPGTPPTDILLRLRLACSSNGTIRPSDVLAGLGLDKCSRSIHRTTLGLAE